MSGIFRTSSNFGSRQAAFDHSLTTCSPFAASGASSLVVAAGGTNDEQYYVRKQRASGSVVHVARAPSANVAPNADLSTCISVCQRASALRHERAPMVHQRCIGYVRIRDA